MRIMKVVTMLALVAPLGCSHTQTAKRTPEGPSLAEPAPARQQQQKQEAPAPEEKTATPEPTARVDGDGAIYFSYDSSQVEGEGRPRLQRVAEELKRDPKAKVRIEGNCDERGTGEYNMALGAHRADAAKRYLQSLGIAPSRIKTISYGKEKPKYQGHDEDSWTKNRRDDVSVR
jgi:peptidoglycan-associated lipoprotein